MRLKIHTILFAMLMMGLSSCGCFTFSPPRCRVDGCHVRMIHAHGGQDFRGQPFWKRNQNPKVGQGFKKPQPYVNAKKPWWKIW